MTIEEAIKQRHSVRKYIHNPLSTEVVMRDFTEIWQFQDTIITAVNACGYGVWDLHATSWGFHLELTEHLDDAEICNICSQLPLSGDYEGEDINGSVLSLYNY